MDKLIDKYIQRYDTIREMNKITKLKKIQFSLWDDELDDIPNLLSDLKKRRETTHNINNEYAECGQFVCEQCGIELQDWHRYEFDEDDQEKHCFEYEFRYCPHCGRKIEGE